MRFLILHKNDSVFASDAIFLFERALIEAGDECVFRVVDEATSVDAPETFDAIVLSGKDSFIAAELALLAHITTPLCVFCGGDTNLFFQTLENAAEPSAIARAVRMGKTAATDLGRLNWRCTDGKIHTKTFAIMSGTGFDAELMRGATQNKKVMGNAAYFLAAANNPHPDVSTYTIVVDGKTYTKRGISCIIANTSMLVGGIEIVSDCSLTDQLLDCIVLEVPDTLGLMRPFLRGLLDPRGHALGRTAIFHAQGAHIEVTSSIPQPMQIDGELTETATTHFSAEVIPQANHVIVDEFSRYAQ